MEIYFQRNGRKDCTDVEVRVETDLQIDKPVLPFVFRTENSYSAILLQQYLSKAFSETLQEERKKAYDEGHADGRGHKPKKKIFSCCLEGTGSGCW